MEQLLLGTAVLLFGSDIALRIWRRATDRILDAPVGVDQLNALYGSLDRRVTTLEAAIVEVGRTSRSLAAMESTVEGIGRSVEEMRTDAKKLGEDLHVLIGFVRGFRETRSDS